MEVLDETVGLWVIAAEQSHDFIHRLDLNWLPRSDVRLKGTTNLKTHVLIK